MVRPEKKRMHLFRMSFESAPSPLICSLLEAMICHLYRVLVWPPKFRNSVFGFWGNHKMLFLSGILKSWCRRKSAGKCILKVFLTVSTLLVPRIQHTVFFMLIGYLWNEWGLMGARPSAITIEYSQCYKNSKGLVRWSWMITGVRSWNFLCHAKLRVTVLSNVTMTGIRVWFTSKVVAHLTVLY